MAPLIFLTLIKYCKNAKSHKRKNVKTQNRSRKTWKIRIKYLRFTTTVRLIENYITLTELVS
jgi:hypothetical protein